MNDAVRFGDDQKYRNQILDFRIRGSRSRAKINVAFINWIFEFPAFAKHEFREREIVSMVEFQQS